MNFFNFSDEFRHPLFENKIEVNKKELFLSPTAAVFRDVDHARKVLGVFVDQICVLVLTLNQQDYVQIGQNSWALSIDSILRLPETQQAFFVTCLLKNLNHICEINDEKSSVALELSNLKNQFKELNQDFLVITKKMERDKEKKLSQKDALIYASQKIGKNGGFEINLVTGRTESTPFLLEMLGVKEFNPLSQDWPLNESSRKKFLDAIERLKEGVASENFQIECLDGALNKTFQVDLVSLGHEDGTTRIIQGSMTDTSLMNNLLKENEKQKAIAVAASKLASLGEMAGGVAHEINNPIAIIIGLLYKLKHRFESNKLDQTEFESIFEKTQKSINRIVYIVSGLRSFSRDGSNDQMEMKSIRCIIDDTLSFCEAKIEQSGITLDFSAVPPHLEILCRPTEISQVFLNLISNSTDAIVDLDQKWIRISAEEFEDFIHITVTDSGRGIDPSIIDKIVDPFFTTKPFGKGTGLGLSISHGIAKRHNGSLFVNPNSQHTQFVLVLPIAKKLVSEQK